MKCPVYEMSYLWNALSMKYMSMKCPIYEMSYLRNTYECPIYEMTQHQVYPVNLPGTSKELSKDRIVWFTRRIYGTGTLQSRDIKPKNSKQPRRSVLLYNIYYIYYIIHNQQITSKYKKGLPLLSLKELNEPSTSDRQWVFATNSNFIIPISLPFDG